MRRWDFVVLYSNPSSDHGKSAVPGAPTTPVATTPTSSAVDDNDDVRGDCLLLPLFGDDDDSDERWTTAEDGRGGAAVNDLHPREAARTGRRARDILMVPDYLVRLMMRGGGGSVRWWWVDELLVVRAVWRPDRDLKNRWIFHVEGSVLVATYSI